MSKQQFDTGPHAPSDILIIEDERDTATLYQNYLEDQYSTTLATSGEQALEELNPRIDLILLDLNLPRMNGKKVIEAIEEDEVEHTEPRIIILTTRDPTPEILDYPVDKYKMKPIYRDDLQSLIHDIALQNEFQNLSNTLFQKRSKRNSLNQAGKTDTETYRELLNSIDEIESKLTELYEQIAAGD
ncbi:response regulator [Halosimplex pelagicum]|uniref:Response regulator n=1 Tax=Halosimplex pelagicum TaxID=869886 RepID=A0A7D5P6U4_9EURY|nr:response regulator [Halosimplex pelagicum]QLH82297.1 response regulator [Halosimplex pelagicum]